MTLFRPIAIAAVLCACAVVPTHECARQWEQTAYSARADTRSPSGIGLDGPLDGDAIDAVADGVDACLLALDGAARAADCLPRDEWRPIDREATTVLAVRGEPSCTRPGLWLLPDSAGSSCETWGKPGSACPCRWAVATQDCGLTVVVPSQAPTQRLSEGLARQVTGCRWQWSDPGIAECSAEVL